MNWITVPYNSNQSYIVQESAIVDAVSNAIESTKYVKSNLSNMRLSFDDDHSNVQIYIDVKIRGAQSNEIDPYAIIKDLTFKIEESIKSLIDKKPKNVQVVLMDIY
ncbi:MMB_0454 family protein [Mycoplasma sp. VS42A]|uniref:MMB_0454 family protein n=1 Tax=Mycoplasma sp. VS42A TaxID=3398774 RepID=UPI003A8B5F63